MFIMIDNVVLTSAVQKSVSVVCVYMCVYVCVCVYIGEGNGTPLQYSCLENPMHGAAW